MKTHLHANHILVTLFTIATCSMPINSAAAAPAMLTPWTGPHGGVPNWSAVKVEEFPQAFALAMDQQRAEIARITNNKAKPTFENTIVALERSGEAMTRVYTYYNVHSSVLNVGKLPAIKRELAPKLAAFGDEINQNLPLFKRIAAVYEAREKLKLTAEQLRLTWLT